MISTENINQSRFQDAEHLWFWFVSSRRMQSGLGRRSAYAERPCELLDIETLVTQMYLSGRLSAEQLEVLKKYGESRRIPNQHVWSENRDAALWLSAMRALGLACRSKGWIE